MNLETIEQYAPWILIILVVIWQNNIFVRPEQLEKKTREILDDVKKKYVEINAYKEFQTHIYSKFDEVIGAIDDVKEIFLKRRKDD
jgi:hypothetical protein